MIAIEFKPEHLDLIEELTLETHEVTRADVEEIYRNLNQDSVMLTIIDDGRVICICGIVSLWQGVGEAINIKTKYMKPHHIRFVKKQFDYRMEYFDRIQTHSRPNMWEKWHKLLGFHKEVVLKKYSNGEDKILWVRFK